MTVYTREFFARFVDGSLRSARAVLPVVFTHAPATSAIDVGCGVGAWLRAAMENGIARVAGVDGTHIDPQTLLIDPRDFIAAALDDDFTRVVTRHDSRRFDIAFCLEVAEHLPPSAAGRLVEGLTALSDVVLFSAAVPFQGGTGHVNEQWPEYWATLFHRWNYTCFDFVRHQFWTDARVDWWYAQNLLLFARQGSKAAERFPAESHRPLAMIHPCNYLCRAIPSGFTFFQDWYALSRQWQDGPAQAKRRSP